MKRYGLNAIAADEAGFSRFIRRLRNGVIVAAAAAAMAPAQIFAVVIAALPHVVRQRVFTKLRPTSAVTASAAKMVRPSW